jgi:hypothetical protein
LANRSKGYLSAAVRDELGDELTKVKAALPQDVRARVADVTITTDVYAPLAAYADRATKVITVSEGLIRYAFIRAVVAHENALADVFRQLAQDRDQAKATADVIRLAEETLSEFRASLSFTLGHELSHIWVPTVDEREADCNGLATVIAERGKADVEIFASIKDAIAEGRSAYWNGLSARLIDQRFKLIDVWQQAALKGANIHALCVEAWKWLANQ